MTAKRKTSPLAAKLDQLGITVDECAAVCGVPVEEVTDFIENGPDAEGAIRLRWLDDDDDALRRVEQLRRTYTRSMLGEGIEHAGVTPPPYGGGFEGADAQPIPTVPPLLAPTRRTLEVVQDGARYGGST